MQKINYFLSIIFLILISNLCSMEMDYQQISGDLELGKKVAPSTFSEAALVHIKKRDYVQLHALLELSKNTCDANLQEIDNIITRLKACERREHFSDNCNNYLNKAKKMTQTIGKAAQTLGKGIAVLSGVTEAGAAGLLPFIGLMNVIDIGEPTLQNTLRADAVLFFGGLCGFVVAGSLYALGSVPEECFGENYYESRVSEIQHLLNQLEQLKATIET